MNVNTLAFEIAHGRAKSFDKRTLGRLMSVLENDLPGCNELLSAIGKQTGSAYRIGLTGPPGAGKSTLASVLAEKLSESKRVGIIAVDPTSPFSGGAILGDRFRMNALSQNASVYIRSMATRGSMGGLTRTAYRIADLMDACGFEYILFETVGVGQAEIDITGHADSTLVILVPESGDGIQAMKSGLMEIADIFVVNKSDRDAADAIKREIENALELRPQGDWAPPVIKTVATSGEGIDDVREAIERHRQQLLSSRGLESRRKRRLRHEIVTQLEDRFRQQWSEGKLPEIDRLVDRVYMKEMSVVDAVQCLWQSEG